MLVWTLIAGGSLAYNLYQHRQAFIAEAYARAKSIHAQDMLYRQWVINHGGVYVPVSKDTPPSEFLKDVPERDIVTPSGRKLTLLNSSYVTRQVHALSDQESGDTVRGHIASLDPINPVNKADSWEVTALKGFEQGKGEVTGIEKRQDGRSYFRFMKPMVTEEACLKCHAQQGYDTGDIRGGISVSIPVDSPLAAKDREVAALTVGHGAIWLLGLVGLFVAGRRQRQGVLSIEAGEARARLLTDSIAHAIYGQDLDGNCTFANAACVKQLGYERESELLGKNMHALMHHSRGDGSPYPVEACPTHQSIHEGKIFHGDEDLFWRKDGTSFPVEYWSYPVEREGRRHGAVVTFLDITEQKKVDDELKRSRQLLDSIVEHIPAMVFLKRAEDLRFEIFNRAGEKLLGYSRQELLGKTDYDLFPKEQAESFVRKDRAVLESHVPLEVAEELVETSDGTKKWLHTFKVGLYDMQSRPTHLLGVSMDITARKEAEADFRIRQDNLIEAQRIALIGSWELDLQADSLHWSDEIYRMFEIDQTRFGASYEAFLDVIHPEDREVVNRAYADSLENRQPYEIEHRLLMKDGRIKYVLERCETRYGGDGKPLRSIGTVQDITERKKAEVALEHANRALQALSTVNRELVHATDEEKLLQAICNAIIGQTKYRMAWVGYVEHDDAKSIRQVASAGDDQGVLALVRPSWAEDEYGTGPSGRAVRSNETQVSGDIANDSQYQSWGAALVSEGCVASIALPLAENGRVFGVLHVYAGEVNAFTGWETSLLEEMAEDLAFGVATLRLRLERDKALKQIEMHSVQLHKNLEETIVAISKAVEARDPYTAGHQRRVAELACAIAAKMGLDEDFVEGIQMGATIHDSPQRMGDLGGF